MIALAVYGIVAPTYDRHMNQSSVTNNSDVVIGPMTINLLPSLIEEACSTEYTLTYLC